MKRKSLAFMPMLIVWLFAVDVTRAQVDDAQRGDVRLGAPTLSQIAPAKMISGQQASPLFFVDQMTGWVLRKGVLYGTADGGNSWNILNSSDTRRITKVYFLDEKNGWAINDSWTTRERSNYVLRTQDGGRAWEKVYTVPTPIYTIFFLNNRVGYFTPRWEPIRRTVDSGHEWKEINSPEGLNYVFFVNEKTGWGYGTSIWRTEDGGQNWLEDKPNKDVSDLYGAKLLSEQSGWIIGNEGQVWRKVGAKGWHRVTNLPVVEKKFYGIDFVDDNEGWITIGDGTVLYTADGGASWQVIAHRPQALTAVRFTGRYEGWALDSKDNLLRTSDGGKQWKLVHLP
jgi:photosystem II stability/assembly factor-like uncharacterized protein